MVDVDAIMAQAPTSVGALFNRRVRDSGLNTAFRFPKDSGWVSLNWLQTKEQVDALAAGLLALGLRQEERVAVASTTRLEWILMDLAINSAGGATTTIYPNTGPEDFAHIVTHCDTVIFVAENATQLAKLQNNPTLVAQVRHTILIDGTATGPNVSTWAELLASGREHLKKDPDCVQRATDATRPDHLATLIYTSGTTGVPKGVELTHSSWVYEGEILNAMRLIAPNKLQYLWLPLSHVFGKLLIAAQLSIGFATAVDGRQDKIGDGLGVTQPTFMCAVPRVFEKVRNAVLTSAPKGTLKGRISRWAFAVGKDARPYLESGDAMPTSLRVRYGIADRLVFTKLRDRLGGRLEFMISGSAKLSTQVQDWFFSAGILIVEGYGMTETSAVTCVNDPKTPRFGTVGPAIPGTTLRIAEDGEVLIKGPGVMRGYHKEPELTAESLVDGWFHTGDIGHVDADGYLTITDRKKDLMKTSGGKYVAPQKVENAVSANIPYVSQVVAIGDGRKYVSALLTLDPNALLKWAANHKVEGLSYAELTQLPEIRRSIDRFLARANAKLEPWETVKRYAILDHEFNVDDGTTTPSMKVRRSSITSTYASVVDSLYDAEE